jgi:hypothetical protein
MEYSSNLNRWHSIHLEFGITERLQSLCQQVIPLGEISRILLINLSPPIQRSETRNFDLLHSLLSGVTRTVRVILDALSDKPLIPVHPETWDGITPTQCAAETSGKRNTIFFLDGTIQNPKREAHVARTGNKLSGKSIPDTENGTRKINLQTSKPLGHSEHRRNWTIRRYTSNLGFDLSLGSIPQRVIIGIWLKVYKYRCESRISPFELLAVPYSIMRLKIGFWERARRDRGLRI